MTSLTTLLSECFVHYKGLIIYIYTAGKISIEHVTIFLSKYISKDAVDTSITRCTSITVHQMSVTNQVMRLQTTPNRRAIITLMVMLWPTAACDIKFSQDVLQVTLFARDVKENTPILKNW